MHTALKLYNKNSYKFWTRKYLIVGHLAYYGIKSIIYKF